MKKFLVCDWRSEIQFLGADLLTLGGGILKNIFLQALVGRKKLHAAQM